MAEQTIEERLNELKQKRDHVGDLFGAADLQTLIEAIEYAMSHGGDVSVAVTPVENGYKITVTDSEGNTQVATVQNGGDAYEVYKSTVPSGQEPMSKTEWLASLKGGVGADGADAVNPYKGRFDTDSDLEAAYPSAADGDYAAVYDDNEEKHFLYKWDSTANSNAGGWVATTIEVSPSASEIGSGQALSAIRIVNPNTSEENDAANIELAPADDTRVLNQLTRGLGFEEDKIGSLTEEDYAIDGNDGSEYTTAPHAQYGKHCTVALTSDMTAIRFLAAELSDTSKYPFGWAFYDSYDALISYGIYKSKTGSTSYAYEIILAIPDGAVKFAFSTSSVNRTKRYCYTQKGETLKRTLDNVKSNVNLNISSLYPTGGIDGGDVYTLQGAIAQVPQDRQVGGLSISFKKNADKYCQYKLTTSVWSASVSDWQGIDEEPVFDSENLITSGAVKEVIDGQKDDVTQFSVNLTSGSTLNKTQSVRLKANVNYLVRFIDGTTVVPNIATVTFYDIEGNSIPIYVDTGNSTSSNFSANQTARKIRQIRLTRECYSVKLYSASSNIEASGSIGCIIEKVGIKKTLDKTISNSGNDGTNALLLKNSIRTTQPYFFDEDTLVENIATVESFEDNSYLEQRIKDVPLGKHFILTTDSHIDYNVQYPDSNHEVKSDNPVRETSVMKYVKDRLNVRNVIFGGDAVGGIQNKYKAARILSYYCNDKFNAFGRDFIYCQGNHDANWPAYNNADNKSELDPADILIPSCEIYKHTTRPMKEYGIAVFDDNLIAAIEQMDFSGQVDNETGKDAYGYTAAELKEELKAWAMLHYYYDDDKQKIRYIVIETDDYSHASKLFGGDITTVIYSELDFVASSLLSIPSGYDVVFVGHQIDTVDIPDSTDFTANNVLGTKVFHKLVYAYITKGYFQYRCKSASAAMLPQLYKIMYGRYVSEQYRKFHFGGVKGSGRLMMVRGHSHYDIAQIYTRKTDETTGAGLYPEYVPLAVESQTYPEGAYYPIITFDKATLKTSSVSTDTAYRRVYPGQGYDEGNEERIGTVNEVLFDVVTITEDDRIVITRFGGGGSSYDREYQIYRPTE